MQAAKTNVTGDNHKNRKADTSRGYSIKKGSIHKQVTRTITIKTAKFPKEDLNYTLLELPLL